MLIMNMAMHELMSINLSQLRVDYKHGRLTYSIDFRIIPEEYKVHNV